MKIDSSCLGGPQIDLPCKSKFKAKMYLYFFTKNKKCFKQKKSLKLSFYWMYYKF